jgi:hypothetical protein
MRQFDMWIQGAAKKYNEYSLLKRRDEWVN